MIFKSSLLIREIERVGENKKEKRTEKGEKKRQSCRELD